MSPTAPTRLQQTYKGYTDDYKLDHMDETSKDEFLTQDGWVRP